MATKIVMRQRSTLKLRFQPGATGPAGTITVGDVTTGAPGTDVEVTNTGTPENAVLDFTIPQGDTGEPNTLTIGTVDTLPYGDPATAEITGTAPNQTLNLGLPMGEQGPAGSVTDGDKGDITVSSLGSVWTVDNNAVTDAKLRDSAALSVIGRSANSSGDPADITAGTDGHVLRRSGTTLGFGTTDTGGITDDAVTNAKLANMANGTFKGRTAGTTGDPEDLTASQVRSGLGIGDNVLVGLTTATSNFKFDVTAVIPFDDTPPQITEGTEVLTLAFTPKAIGNKFLFRVLIPVIGFASNIGPIGTLFLDAVNTPLNVGIVQLNDVSGSSQFALEAVYTAVDTSAHTLRLRMGPRTTGQVMIGQTSNDTSLFSTAPTIIMSAIEARV